MASVLSQSFSQRWLAARQRLSWMERRYASLVGPPILGLRVRAHYLRPWLQTAEFDRALDVGCGQGFFAAALAASRPWATVLGVDLDPRLTAVNARAAERLDLANLRFLCADVSSLRDTGFDLVLLIHCLEHVPHDIGLLRAVREAMVPGGVLIVAVPTRPRGWLSSHPTLRDFPGHVRPGYDGCQLVALLERTGFVIDEMVSPRNAVESSAQRLGAVITGGVGGRRLLYGLFLPVALAAVWASRRLPPHGHADGLFCKTRRR